VVKQYFPWADCVRVVALFLVVVLHSAAIYVLGWGQISWGWWLVANLVDSFARVAVPLFVMLSGALLLPKSELATAFYSKRMIRVVIPWLFWATASFCFGLMSGGIEAFVKKPISTLFHAYITSYWYVALLLVIYLLTPALRWWVRRQSLMVVWWSAVVLLGSAATLSWWFEVSHQPRLVQLAWLLAFKGYFLLGFLLRAWFEQRKLGSYRGWLVVLVLMGWLLTAAGTWWSSYQQARFIQLFYDYAFSSVIIQGAALFGLVLLWADRVKLVLAKSPQLSWLVAELSRLSYGIFLIQSGVVTFLLRSTLLKEGTLQLHPLLGIPVLTLATLTICFLVTKLFSRLPVLRLVV
jgi:surface polysaccharide O-acyltransferase-like enzyme